MPDLRYQLLPNRPPAQADVVVLPVPHEATVSYKPGTRNAPEAILEASGQLEYYEEDQGWSPFRHMGVSVLPPLERRPGEAEPEFHDRLRREASSLPAQVLLLALGGEHSITPALVAGRMEAPGTVVLLDAHGDLRREYEGTRYSHACPMYRVREAGHRLLMAGIRSLYDEEAERVRSDAGIQCFLDRALQRPAGWKILLDALAALEGPVWLTIDMDAFDPAVVPSVGTPQPGGLSWYQVIELVEACVLNERVDLRGCDIVELIPEPSRVSDMVAAKLSQKIISCWGKRHGFDRRSERGSQMEIRYH